jgi:hypothetical protein
MCAILTQGSQVTLIAPRSIQIKQKQSNVFSPILKTTLKNNKEIMEAWIKLTSQLEIK